MTNDNLLQDEDAINRQLQRASATDFLTFAGGLVIPAVSGPRLFHSCMSGFQRECFADLAPSLQAVQQGTLPPRRRFWIERTKKASKDLDLGVCLLWLVAFARRPIYLQAGAADRDQAGIVKRRISEIIFYNPWLEDFVEVYRYEVRNITGIPASLDILAADAAGAHGETPDVLVVNELSHVTKWEFIKNLLDNADGVPQGLVVIATNAGHKGTQADKMRENADTSDRWTVHRWTTPAPWLSDDDIAEAKKRNTVGRFNRLWQGRWASGKGDALSEDDIDRCFVPGLQPLTKPEPGWMYIGGLDLGVSHDHSGLVILGVNVEDQRLRLACMRGWAPNPNTGEVDLMVVEDECYAMHKLFNLHWFGYDPNQAKLMAQRLFRRGVPMRELTFSSGKNLTLMAVSLLQMVEGGKLECFDDDEGRLRRDFGKFNIVERPAGYKLEAVSDEYGHADVGVALTICLPQAVLMLEGYGSLGSGDDLIDENDDPLTEEELQDMPEELRGIIETYNDIDRDNQEQDRESLFTLD